MSVFKKYISNNDETARVTTTPATAAAAPQPTTPRPQENLHSSNKTSLKAPASASAPVPVSATPQPQPQSPPARQPVSQTPPSSPAATMSGRNVLSSDVEIKGKVAFTNDLVVDGLIEGEIHSDGSLTVGENARIKAEVHTRSVVVYGKVHGNITVTDRVELKANAELIGDIKAATISIEAGAIFVGKSTVGAPSTTIAASKDDKKPQADKKSGSKPQGKDSKDKDKPNSKGKLASAS